MRGGLSRPAAAISGRLSQHTAGPKIETQLRAKSTPKHQRVEHFGRPMDNSKFQPSHPNTHKKVVSGELISAGHGHAGNNTSANSVQPMPSMVASASHQKLERLLDEALTKADSHKQALRYHAARHFWQRRWFSGPRKLALVAISLLAIAAILGLAWQKYPSLSMKAAGLRAHISPAVPTYKPDGFKLAGPAKAESGSVSLQYKSASDSSKTYNIIQSQSNLTSTMVSQNVVPKGTAVQTSQVDGNTIYIYGADNDAVWVNNSTLYKIKDNAKLSSDQLINIVRGLNP
jgi:hypothetical protein